MEWIVGNTEEEGRKKKKSVGCVRVHQKTDRTYHHHQPPPPSATTINHHHPQQFHSTKGDRLPLDPTQRKGKLHVRREQEGTLTEKKWHKTTRANWSEGDTVHSPYTATRSESLCVNITLFVLLFACLVWCLIKEKDLYQNLPSFSHSFLLIF